MNPKLSIIIVLISFHLLASFAEGKADRRRALGVGTVGGPLIGGSVGHAFVHHSNHSRYHHSHPSSAANRTVVHHGYLKEITKERDPHNPNKYRKMIRMLYPTSPAVARIVPARHYNATNITHVHHSYVTRVVPVQATTVVIITKTKYKQKHKKSMAYRFVESLMALVVCAVVSLLL